MREEKKGDCQNLLVKNPVQRPVYVVQKSGMIIRCETFQFCSDCVFQEGKHFNVLYLKKKQFLRIVVKGYKNLWL